MSKEARFARLQTDPRFRRPNQKALKVEIDERFKDVLESEEFGGGKSKGKGKGKAVDKRGRPLTSSHHQDQLKRFYRLRSPEGPSDGGFVDYARGEGVLSSSGSEAGSSDDEESEAEEEELEVGGKQSKKAIYDLSDEESESDESHLAIDLSENEDVASQDEDEDEEEEDDGPTIDPTTRIAAVNLDWDNLRAADLFAVFNSFLKMRTTKKGAASSIEGRLLNVKIYPSEFGKTRMAKEELEGPGGGIFIAKPGDKKAKKRKGELVVRPEEEEEEEEEEFESDEEDLQYENGNLSEEDDLEAGDSEGDDNESREDDEEAQGDSDEDSAEEADDLDEGGDELEILSDALSEAGEDDIDMDKLRQYQLERLRYFYAVATYSTVEAAAHVMEECNGTEFERTANVFDLSYAPDGMEFEEDDVKDEATKEPSGYKGNDFVTDALRHSKVKLTWDQDDPNRSKLTRRNLTRDEIEEQDFKTYLASSGSESEDDGPVHEAIHGKTEQSSLKNKSGKENKKAKKAAIKDRTAKLRSLLLSGNEEDGDIWGKAGIDRAERVADTKGKTKAGDADGDMEITFKPGLSVSGKGKENEENLTTLEKYQLRMKEKKARKKEKAELRKAGKEDSAEVEVQKKDDFFGDDSANEVESEIEGPGDEEEEQPLQEELGGKSSHFSMKDIAKAEKGGGKKRTRKSRAKKEAAMEAKGRAREVELGPDDWKINVKDPRFKAIHEEPEFAIDPSNPQFSKTKAMQELLAERARNREKERSESERKAPKPVSEQANGGAKTKDLDALVKSVKRKMEQGSYKKKRSRK